MWAAIDKTLMYTVDVVRSSHQIYKNELNGADCSGDSAAMARIWCDLHCIKSAVQEGDEAILQSLEKAVKVLDQNVDLLTEYYTGLVGDKVDEVMEVVKRCSWISMGAGGQCGRPSIGTCRSSSMVIVEKEGQCDAALLLHDYRHCKADFATLRQGYATSQKAEKQAHEVLLQTWSSTVNLCGLLVSKLVDNDALTELARSEAKAAVSDDDLCQPTGLQIASAAVNRSMAEGLAGQTVRQLFFIFAEMGMLKERFDYAGVEAQDVEVLADSLRRSLDLMQTAERRRGPLAEDLLADANCPHPASS